MELENFILKAVHANDEMSTDKDGKHIIFRNMGGKVIPMHVTTEDYLDLMKQNGIDVGQETESTLRELDDWLFYFDEISQTNPNLAQKMQDQFQENLKKRQQTTAASYTQYRQQLAQRKGKQESEVDTEHQNMLAESQKSGTKPITGKDRGEAWDSYIGSFSDHLMQANGVDPKNHKDKNWGYIKATELLMRGVAEKVGNEGLAPAAVLKDLDKILSSEMSTGELTQKLFDTHFAPPAPDTTGMDAKQKKEAMKKHNAESMDIHIALRAGLANLQRNLELNNESATQIKNMVGGLATKISNEDAQYKSKRATGTQDKLHNDFDIGAHAPDELPDQFGDVEADSLMRNYRSSSNQWAGAHKAGRHAIARLYSMLDDEGKKNASASLMNAKKGTTAQHKRGFNQGFDDERNGGTDNLDKRLELALGVAAEAAKSGNHDDIVAAISNVSKTLGYIDGARRARGEKGADGYKTAKIDSIWATNNTKLSMSPGAAGDEPGFHGIFTDDATHGASLISNKVLGILHGGGVGSSARNTLGNAVSGATGSPSQPLPQQQQNAQNGTQDTSATTLNQPAGAPVNAPATDPSSQTPAPAPAPAPSNSNSLFPNTADGNAVELQNTIPENESDELEDHASAIDQLGISDEHTNARIHAAVGNVVKNGGNVRMRTTQNGSPAMVVSSPDGNSIGIFEHDGQHYVSYNENGQPRGQLLSEANIEKLLPTNKASDGMNSGIPVAGEIPQGKMQVDKNKINDIANPEKESLIARIREQVSGGKPAEPQQVTQPQTPVAGDVRPVNAPALPKNDIPLSGDLGTKTQLPKEGPQKEIPSDPKEAVLQRIKEDLGGFKNKEIPQAGNADFGAKVAEKPQVVSETPFGNPQIGDKTDMSGQKIEPGAKGRLISGRHNLARSETTAQDQSASYDKEALISSLGKNNAYRPDRSAGDAGIPTVSGKFGTGVGTQPKLQDKTPGEIKPVESAPPTTQYKYTEQGQRGLNTAPIGGGTISGKLTAKPDMGNLGVQSATPEAQPEPTQPVQPVQPEPQSEVDNNPAVDTVTTESETTQPEVGGNTVESENNVDTDETQDGGEVVDNGGIVDDEEQAFDDDGIEHDSPEIDAHRESLASKIGGDSDLIDHIGSEGGKHYFHDLTSDAVYDHEGNKIQDNEEGDIGSEEGNNRFMEGIRSQNSPKPESNIPSALSSLPVFQNGGGSHYHDAINNLSGSGHTFTEDGNFVKVHNAEGKEVAELSHDDQHGLVATHEDENGDFSDKPIRDSKELLDHINGSGQTPPPTTQPPSPTQPTGTLTPAPEGAVTSAMPESARNAAQAAQQAVSKTDADKKHPFYEFPSEESGDNFHSRQAVQDMISSGASNYDILMAHGKNEGLMHHDIEEMRQHMGENNGSLDGYEKRGGKSDFISANGLDENVTNNFDPEHRGHIARALASMATDDHDVSFEPGKTKNTFHVMHGENNVGSIRSKAGKLTVTNSNGDVLENPSHHDEILTHLNMGQFRNGDSGDDGMDEVTGEPKDESSIGDAPTTTVKGNLTPAPAPAPAPTPASTTAPTQTPNEAPATTAAPDTQSNTVAATFNHQSYEEPDSPFHEQDKPIAEAFHGVAQQLGATPTKMNGKSGMKFKTKDGQNVSLFQTDEGMRMVHPDKDGINTQTNIHSPQELSDTLGHLTASPPEPAAALETHGFDSPYDMDNEEYPVHGQLAQHAYDLAKSGGYTVDTSQKGQVALSHPNGNRAIFIRGKDTNGGTLMMQTPHEQGAYTNQSAHFHGSIGDIQPSVRNFLESGQYEPGSMGEISKEDYAAARRGGNVTKSAQIITGFKLRF